MDVAEFIRNSVNAWNKRGKDGFLADFAADCEIAAPGGVVLRGRDGAELFWHGYQDAFPDNQITLRSAFGAAGSGLEEATFNGTHTGVLNGGNGVQISPTGRSFSGAFAAVYTYRDQRIATMHVYFDQLDLLTQLGILPST